MSLRLTEYDRACLAGDLGEGQRLAMGILVRMAELWGAGELLDISRAHIDSSLYQGDATLDFAERLAGLGATVSVPATLNVSGVDRSGWRDWDVPEEWADKAHRQMVAYEQMGCEPIWTCTPYQTVEPPELGEQIAWGESNAVAYANSVLGARTEQYPDLLDICAAIVGRAPAAGLHLDANRVGTMHLRLVDVPESVQEDDAFGAVLGNLVGALAGNHVPVIDGVTITPSDDQLKAICAAVASSGAVSMFHIVGVTPEAPSLDAATGGEEPRVTMEITVDDLRASWRELTTAEGEEIELVALGSPHFSLAEFRRLAPLLEGERRSDGTRFLVTSNRIMVQLAEAAGLLDPLREFGGELTVDTCILTSPMLSDDVRRIMTNSPKYAYYGPGLLGTEVAFGALEDCVRSAVAGRVERRPSVWDEAEARTRDRASRAAFAAGGAPRDDRAVRSSAIGAPLAASLAGKVLAPGEASGPALVSDEPISFWGGYDQTSGEIIDRRHPLAGEIAAGKILVVPYTRGSSTTTAVLLESIRAGTAPAALLTGGTDTFLALASIVGAQLYGSAPPVVALGDADLASLRTGQELVVHRDGVVETADDD